jgi:Domain of unknown function (DUF4375)
MKVRRQLSKRLVAREPWARWNAFVDLLATEDFDALEPVQRVAYLVFWYDSEVQNGGHLQYFENEAGRRADEAILALRSIGGVCQADILAAALRTWSRDERLPPETVEEYIENALNGEFDDLDARYPECEPSVIMLLEDYLDLHETAFLEFDAG